jgi:hypothetical protein
MRDPSSVQISDVASPGGNNGIISMRQFGTRMIVAYSLLAFAAYCCDGLREAAAAGRDDAQATASNLSAQTRKRPRITVTPEPQPPAWDYPRPGTYSYPGPGGVRHCEDWYITEYRPSGAVITPQMRCWWVPR